MKFSKIGSAGVKLVGAASCGIGSALSLVAAAVPGRNDTFSTVLYATSAGLAGSGLMLLGQAARDTIDGFRTAERE